MSASVHTLPTVDHVIRRADLPRMFYQTTPELDAKHLPYKLYFDQPNPANTEQFHTMMVEWNDGRTIYLDRLGTDALMTLSENGIANPHEMIQMLSDEPEEYTGVYRVID